VINQDVFSNFKTLWVGLSGGLDSTVLLHLLSSYPELKPKLKAIHVNHGISDNADAWQMHVQQFCQTHHIPLVVERINLRGLSNLEATAREARYRIFQDYVKPDDALVLAHHQDDQVETLLLHLFRGAGVEGLSGMRERTTLFNCQVVRPLLAISRETLLQYARTSGLTWIEDESNTDVSLKRNFLRHEIIPRLKLQWPNVVDKIAMTAGHCQQASDNLYDLAVIDRLPSPTAVGEGLGVRELLTYSEARRTNLLRSWFKSLDIRPPTQAVMNQVLALCEAKVDAMPKVKVGEYFVHRYQGALYIEPPLPKKLAPIAWENYPSPLVIDELQMTIEGIYDVPPGAKVSIRFREGGETIRANGQEKSLKTLMQAWKIPPWRRHLVPLVYVDDRLVGVKYHQSHDRKGVLR